jgi:hypothetical protein
MKLFALFKKKKPEIKWHHYPAQRGWYLSFEHGRGFDELYWPGADDDSFEFHHRRDAKYLGPFQLPLK